jgi:carbamoyl-phosphate synthase small subunit
MTGYQEILTDPSYKGQIVTMTYPLIGNYGVNSQDVESWRPHVAGFVIRELSPVVSNWRADFSLAEYLEKNGIPGIQGIDTRALTKKLRVRGALNGLFPRKEFPRKKPWQAREGICFRRRGLRQGSDAQKALSAGTRRTSRARRFDLTQGTRIKLPTRATCASRCRRRTFRLSRSITG